MQAIQNAPTAIRECVPITAQAFMPLLVKNKAAITAHPPRTESYGSLSRHKVDIYKAQTSSSSSKPPILFFFYGGGLVNGARANPMTQNLVYTNVGSYFASKGYTVLIPDYRLVPAHLVEGGSAPEGAAGGGEPASYPSGAEDVSLAIQWAIKNLADEADVSDISVIGNSAGGLHLGTLLFDKDFYLSDNAGMAEIRSALKTGVFLAPPPDFEESEPERWPTLAAYYGSNELAIKRNMVGLMQDLSTEEAKRLPRMIGLVGELDPQEVLGANERFDKLAREKGAKYSMHWLKETKQGFKHNHISPPFALCSGEGEEWADELVKMLQI